MTLSMYEARNLSKLGKKVLNTKKRKAYLVVAEKHTVAPSYWDEGSKTDTFALMLPTFGLRGLSEVGLKAAVSTPFDERKDCTYGLVENLGFVEVGFFMGKPSAPRIIVSDAALVADLFV